MEGRSQTSEAIFIISVVHTVHVTHHRGSGPQSPPPRGWGGVRRLPTVKLTGFVSVHTAVMGRKSLKWGGVIFSLLEAVVSLLVIWSCAWEIYLFSPREEGFQWSQGHCSPTLGVASRRKLGAALFLECGPGVQIRNTDS